MDTRTLPFTGPRAFTHALSDGAVHSVRLRGVWIHRAAPGDRQPATFPLATGESVRIAGRWFHGPAARTGGA